MGEQIKEKESASHADTAVLESDDIFAENTFLESKTKDSDNVGGSSVEIDVEQLLAEVESEVPDGVDADGHVRKRLEAIMERKRHHDELVDFEEYDLES
jgi:hypothetical protein